MTLQSLITRVEAGSGRDYELDGAICEALQYVGDCPSARNVKALPNAWFGNMIEFDRGNGVEKWIAPALCSSLDAIRALMLARVPGRGLYIFAADDKLPVVIIWESGLMDDCSSDESEKSKHSDIHRAFLSAVLKAIAAKEGV